MSTDIFSYSEKALQHLQTLIQKNEKTLNLITSKLVEDVKEGKVLFVFGSGHSALFPMELYHRAGGASFVIPVIADFLLPSAGPSIVRLLERTPGVATPILDRANPRKDEMIWIASQSGINSAVVDAAIESKKRGFYTVAFTSVTHSSAVSSRHSSKKRLFEVCDTVVDVGGFVGDAAVPIAKDLHAGPLSTLSFVFLGHSILVAATSQLEAEGIHCVYTSVNTPEGEKRNRKLEEIAKERDFLLR